MKKFSCLLLSEQTTSASPVPTALSVISDLFFIGTVFGGVAIRHSIDHDDTQVSRNNSVTRCYTIVQKYKSVFQYTFVFRDTFYSV